MYLKTYWRLSKTIRQVLCPAYWIGFLEHLGNLMKFLRGRGCKRSFRPKRRFSRSNFVIPDLRMLPRLLQPISFGKFQRFEKPKFCLIGFNVLVSVSVGSLEGISDEN